MSTSDGGDPPVHTEPSAIPFRPQAATGDDGPAETLVEVVDGRAKKLDPRHVTAERISGCIAAAVLSGLGLIGMVVGLVGGVLGPPGRLILPVGWVALSGALVSFNLIWPAVRFRHMDYTVSDEEVQIRRGVVWRSVTTVPRNRVQHTDVSQGPIERLFELATLVIYTAGTQYASVHLPGLTRETALRIRDHLIHGGQDDAV